MKYSKDLLKDIIGWDVRNWAEAIKLWDTVLQSPSDPALALELGAREGGLSLYLALKGFQVVCSDVANPEKLARSKHAGYGVEESVTYTAANATALQFENSRFDVVAFKSILGTIGRENHPELQQAAIREIYRVLKPGGVLLFAENLRGTGFHRFFRKFTKWGRYWRYVSVEEIRQFHREFSSFNYGTFGFAGSFGRNESQRRALHYLDRLIDPILRDRHKYIIYGCARK
ncbi:MAG: class I SAM-dependent methyltransferase [Candidatus Zixiibacteriota bacterium]